MSIKFHLDTSPSVPDWLASNIADKPKSILWLKAYGTEGYRVMLNWLYEVPRPFRCSYMAAKAFVGDQQKAAELEWSEHLEARIKSVP